MAKASDEQAALLRAVCAAPDDDLPRLVYADWLDENGRADRARFIRLQIEADRGTGGAGRLDRDEEIGSLLAENRERWFRELPKWAWSNYPSGESWEWPDFRRGFIGDLRVKASPFVRHGVQLTDRTPVTRLTFLEAGKLVSELAVSPWLWRLRAVHFFWENLGDPGAAALFRSPYLPDLEELNLHGCGLTDTSVKALARSGGLANLRVLRLRCNDVTEVGIRALSESRYLPKLQTVDVRFNRRAVPVAPRLGRECRFAVEG